MVLLDGMQLQQLAPSTHPSPCHFLFYLVTVLSNPAHCSSIKLTPDFFPLHHSTTIAHHQPASPSHMFPLPPPFPPNTQGKVTLRTQVSIHYPWVSTRILLNHFRSLYDLASTPNIFRPSPLQAIFPLPALSVHQPLKCPHSV